MVTLPAIRCSDPIFDATRDKGSHYIDAISRYCKVLGSREPIYSLKRTKDGQYICDLTLPGNAPCPIIRANAEKHRAKSVVARDACARLIERGELDENLVPLRAPSVTPRTCSFGNVKLSEERQRTLGLLPVPINMLQVALDLHYKDITSSSWEALGEAFIKFFWGTYFFAQHQDDLEGALTTRIQNETGRGALMDYFVSSGLPQNVCTNPGGTGYGINRATEITRRVIGAAVIHGGVDTAMDVTRALGAGVDTSLTSISSIRIVHQLNRVVDLDIPITIYNSRIPRAMDVETTRIAQKVQEVFEYQFRDIQLLLQAMTHRDTKVGTSYERLELLGDAVLEMVMTEYYYRKCPDAPLEGFKCFTSQILSNNALGSHFVSLGLHDSIIVSNLSFKMSLEKEAARVNQLKSNKKKGWHGLNIDKVFGDVLEALIGAVFVDGEFAIEPVEEILKQTLVPFIDRSGLECPTSATCPITVLPTGGKRKKGSAGSRKRAKNQ
ncbi:Dicer-like protein 2 [Mortierella sp. AD011]|nr:Dicer-like protein 2 [Mortierella sp. AD011]